MAPTNEPSRFGSIFSNFDSEIEARRQASRESEARALEILAQRNAIGSDTREEQWADMLKMLAPLAIGAALGGRKGLEHGASGSLYGIKHSQEQEEKERQRMDQEVELALKQEGFDRKALQDIENAFRNKQYDAAKFGLSEEGKNQRSNNMRDLYGQVLGVGSAQSSGSSFIPRSPQPTDSPELEELERALVESPDDEPEGTYGSPGGESLEPSSAAQVRNLEDAFRAAGLDPNEPSHRMAIDSALKTQKHALDVESKNQGLRSGEVETQSKKLSLDDQIDRAIRKKEPIRMPELGIKITPQMADPEQIAKAREYLGNYATALENALEVRKIRDEKTRLGRSFRDDRMKKKLNQAERFLAKMYAWGEGRDVVEAQAAAKRDTPNLGTLRGEAVNMLGPTSPGSRDQIDTWIENINTTGRNTLERNYGWKIEEDSWREETFLDTRTNEVVRVRETPKGWVVIGKQPYQGGQ